MSKFVIRKPYERNRVMTAGGGESCTKQSHQAECDINTILKRYQKNGVLTHYAKFGGHYEDLPSDIDYQAGMNAIIQAEDAFMSLPSQLRNRFSNDPARFLAFVQDPANAGELESLGLTRPKPAEPLLAAEPKATPLTDPSGPS